MNARQSAGRLNQREVTMGRKVKTPKKRGDKKAELARAAKYAGEGHFRTAVTVDKNSGYHAVAKHLVAKFHVKTTGEEKRTVYVYDEGRYVVGLSTLKTEIDAVVGGLATVNAVNEIIERVKNTTQTAVEDFAVDSNLINLANGTFNLSNFTLTPHTPDNLFLHKLPPAYEPDADCPQFKKFLSEIATDEAIAIIQELMGYCLYREHPFKKGAVAVGPPNGGKSTLINILKALIGSDNITEVDL